MVSGVHMVMVRRWRKLGLGTLLVLASPYRYPHSDNDTTPTDTFFFQRL
jgi:hypothetical protein